MIGSFYQLEYGASNGACFGDNTLKQVLSPFKKENALQITLMGKGSCTAVLVPLGTLLRRVQYIYQYGSSSSLPAGLSTRWLDVRRRWLSVVAGFVRKSGGAEAGYREDSRNSAELSNSTSE